MRELIVKYGFGKYYWKFWFQSHYNDVHRGSFWYMNGFVLIGLLWMITGRPEWLILWPSVIWFLFVLYFGFPVAGLGYFQKFPVKWDELDDEQKWYYGNGINSGDLRKKIYLTIDQHEEYLYLKKKFQKKYNMNQS